MGGGKGSHHHQPFHPVIRCLYGDGLLALCPGQNEGDDGLQRYPSILPFYISLQ